MRQRPTAQLLPGRRQVGKVQELNTWIEFHKQKGCFIDLTVLAAVKCFFFPLNFCPLKVGDAALFAAGVLGDLQAGRTL